MTLLTIGCSSMAGLGAVYLFIACVLFWQPRIGIGSHYGPKDLDLPDCPEDDPALSLEPILERGNLFREADDVSAMDRMRELLGPWCWREK